MGTNKTDTYEDHCAEIEHHDKEGDDDEEGDEGDEDDEGKDANELKPGETEIISARDSMHELPVLVFEGVQFEVMNFSKVPLKENFPRNICYRVVHLVG